jgi:ABC-type Fe3+-hydroxamate transport system substrate-binding protein
VRGRILIALALVGALAGCQESGFDESRETQRPLKVQHALDPLTGTKVPGQAERPLALTADALGDTLALGVAPVGAAEVPPYLRKQAGEVPVLPPHDPVELEAVDPDVILGSKESNGDDYDALSQIAPTVMSEGSDWKLNLRLHGEALGRTNDAEALLIDWDNRVAKVKRALHGRRLAVRLPGGGLPGPVGHSVLADLGLAGAGGGAETVRVKGGPEWSTGGLLAARAVLDQLAALG